MVFNLPQDHLQRIPGTPYYATPNTPADPQDCNRYPNSPWCGGSGFSLDSPVGFELSIVQDECNLGIQFDATLAYINLPSFQLVYRPYYCRFEPEPPSVPDQIEDNSRAYCLDGSSWGLVLMGDSIDQDEAGNPLFLAGSPANEYFQYMRTIANFAAAEYAAYLIENNIEVTDIQVIHSEAIPRGFYLAKYNKENDIINQQEIRLIFGTIKLGNIFVSSMQLQDTTGELLEVRQQIAPYSPICNIPFPPCEKEPPPPPPKKECCDMPCCPDNSNLERLLRLVLQKIGSTSLPASVPVSLTRANSGTLQIQSLAEYLAYSVKQTNNQFGQFPQEINIEDADLTQESNQGKTIKLPNLAESIAEIIGILLVLQSESNANLIATVSGMIEAGSAKQAASLAVDYSKANSEYLGYKGKQLERKLPFTFKPGESRLDKMLVSGEVSVKGFENDDKDDLNDALAPLLELAAMWKAANFKNLGTSDTLGKLRSALKGAVDISKAVDNLVKTSPPQDPNNPTPSTPKKSDWDTFLEQAEQGFIAQPGITDPTNPYSRPLDQRPKIREIGNDTSDTSSSGQ